MSWLNRDFLALAGLRLTLLGALPGLVADAYYVANTYRIFHSRGRLIRWGGSFEEFLAFCLLASAGMLFLGLLVCVCSLPRRAAFRGVGLAILLLAIHVAALCYSRHMFSFA